MLEKEKADLLKLLSRRLTELEDYLTQNKAIAGENAYQCFFEVYDALEDNKKQQWLLLKPKHFENFDTKRLLEGKSKVLRWVVYKVTFLRDIENYRTELFHCRKNRLPVYKLDEVRVSVSISIKMSTSKKKLKAENLSHHEEQTVCSQLEELVKKLDEGCAKCI